MHTPNITRRHFFHDCAVGTGKIALASLLAESAYGASKSPNVAAASHFSCVGATRTSVREQLQTLKGMGVKRLVALRGDLPSGYGAGDIAGTLRGAYQVKTPMILLSSLEPEELADLERELSA